MIGLMLALVLGTSQLWDDRRNDPDIFQRHLMNVAKGDGEIDPNILGPALSPAQIERLGIVKGRRFPASFASTYADRLISWVGDEGQQSHGMEITVRGGAVVKVTIDKRAIWPTVSDR